MFEVLPIKNIRDEDAPLVGQDIVNLARLAQSGFPVASLLVVLPPDFKLRTILKRYQLKDREVYEQTFTLIKKEILSIVSPEALCKEIKAKDQIKIIWSGLLNTWTEELRRSIWENGLGVGVTGNLSAQTVILEDDRIASGKGWEDPNLGEMVVEIVSGKMGEKTVEDIKEMVGEANKKLFIPQVYFWVLNKNPRRGLQLIGLVPFTPKDEVVINNGLNLIPVSSDQRAGKSVVKVFQDISSGLVINRDLDGALIRAEGVAESVNGIKDKFEALVFRLVEGAEVYRDLPVIFKLSDKVEQKNGVRGSLRLIHQESLFREETEAFLFARNKPGLPADTGLKNFLNLALAVPFVRSIDEFLQIKRDLAVKGISRKGSMKLWMEAAVPENLINIEDYLIAGVDGIILNLDELASALGGFDLDIPESIFYKGQVKALIRFLDEPLRIIHRSKVPFLGVGSLCLHSDVLEFLIEKGIYGVAADKVNSEFLPDHLKFLEKRYLRSKSV